jgi:general stress protein CsbA
VRSLRFVVLVLVVVLALSLIPDLAERDWISVIVAGLLIGVLVLWYKTLKRRP